MLYKNEVTVCSVTEPVRHVLHGHLHTGAVSEAGDVRAGAAPGRLPALRIQRPRHARCLRLAHLYEL